MDIGHVAEAVMLRGAKTGQELNVALVKQQNEMEKGVLQMVSQATQQTAQAAGAAASGKIDISV